MKTRKIRIWTLEDDYDAATVKCLACKIKDFLLLENIEIAAVGKSAIPKRAGNSLLKAVKNYLREDDFLVFVIDSDGPMTAHERLQQPNSLINQITKVLHDEDVKGKVFLVQAVCELEAWLLIDCIGIMCYYLKYRYKTGCREKVAKDPKLIRMIKKFQRGKTNLIVEAEPGGTSAKEYLKRYTESIIKILNPKISEKDVSQKRYHVSFSPHLAEFIEIDSITLRRNDSLILFSDLLDWCNNLTAK